jgi:hypothetical protein
VVRAGIYQKGPGKAGVELGKLPEQRALKCTALNGVQVGDVALVHAEGRVEGAQQCHWVARMLGDQL